MQSGSYSTITTNNEVCSDTSACQTHTVAALNDPLTLQELSIFPNPCNGIYTLPSQNQLKGTTLSVANSIGVIIFETEVESGTEHTIDLPKNLTAYILSRL